MRSLRFGLAGLVAAIAVVATLPLHAHDVPAKCKPKPRSAGVRGPGWTDVCDTCDSLDPANACWHCKRGLHRCCGWWSECCAKCNYWACCGVYPMNGGYIDPRDTVLYSAEGYGMPMAVPLAPVVRYQYNYGWGLPSSRLTTPGYYANYWPSAFTSQGGNPATRGPHPPMVYWPTDTTQLGYYGMRVPHWVEGQVPFN